LELCHSW